jgi:hypothetical protein
VIDFTNVVGNVTLRTDANKPMPGGDPVDYDIDSLIMRFVVYQQQNVSNTTVNATNNSAMYNLNYSFPSFSQGERKLMVLNEI